MTSADSFCMFEQFHWFSVSVSFWPLQSSGTTDPGVRKDEQPGKGRGWWQQGTSPWSEASYWSVNWWCGGRGGRQTHGVQTQFTWKKTTSLPSLKSVSFHLHGTVTIFLEISQAAFALSWQTAQYVSCWMEFTSGRDCTFFITCAFPFSPASLRLF